MNQTSYPSEAACRNFVTKELGIDLPHDLAKSLAARLAPACQEHFAPKTGLGLVIRQWVIRQEDLGFFGVLRTSALAFVASATAAPVAGPVVAALAAIAELGWNMWRKGARLETRDLQVLIALEKSSRPLTPGEIAKSLSTKTEGWSTADVKAVLTRLGKLPTRSGSIAVVHETEKGRWRAAH
jgi:hypothetical protein